jgi:cell wall-associated NlpC family hydrolase
VQLLTDLANGLRNIRYRRGGRTPTSGFDCSGFVRYVFRQGIGAELPNTSAAQFRSGQAVARDALRGGDLVFFRTRGKHVSHVGIYLGDDRFIHAPSSGKTVSVSRLTDRYWARRYAGARRADVLVAHEDGAASGSS